MNKIWVFFHLPTVSSCWNGTVKKMVVGMAAMVGLILQKLVVVDEW